MRLTGLAWAILCGVVLLGCAGAGGGGTGPSARCVDGTLSYSQNCSGTCSSHGGVAEWFNGCGSSSGGSGGGQSIPITTWAGSYDGRMTRDGVAGTLTIAIDSSGKGQGTYTTGMEAGSASVSVYRRTDEPGDFMNVTIGSGVISYVYRGRVTRDSAGRVTGSFTNQLATSSSMSLDLMQQ